MKELTIEEKAKAYDLAIEKLRNAFYGNNSRMCEEYRQAVIRIIEPIFPELKKPEDEEIRKGLIENFKWFCGDYPETAKWGKDDNLLVKDIIAWLEKQGETFTKKDVDDAWLEGMYYAKHELEKQGEQKPADKVEPKDYNSIDPHFGKPADKIEPKFHKGEWIVWQDKCYKVNYNGCGYELVDQNGLNTSLEYGTVDESAHVWDITKDAKDGDVLADNVGVILFKSIGDNNVINYYAYFSGLFAVQEGEHYWGHVRECTLSPATKEQRDTFEKAMVDAGWEFDFEKKELKKISQRMISAEAKEAMYGKPAWNEEDEKMIRPVRRKSKKYLED